MKSLITALGALTVAMSAHAATAASNTNTCDAQDMAVTTTNWGDQPWTITDTRWYSHACDAAATN